MAEIQQLRQQVLQVRVDSVLQKYILALVRASRESDRITLGVSPRGTVMLQRTAQALAFLNGRDYVLPDDVKQLAPHVLAHRLITAAGRSGRPVWQNCWKR